MPRHLHVNKYAHSLGNLNLCLSIATSTSCLPRKLHHERTTIDRPFKYEESESKAIAACRVDLSNSEQQIGRLKALSEGFQASLAEATQLAANRKVEIDQLRSELEKNPGTDPGIKDQLATLQNALDRAKRTIDQQDQDIAELKNAL